MDFNGADFVQRLKDVSKCSTQKAIAEKLNIDVSTITEWVKKNKQPKTETLLLISETFDCSIDYLLNIRPKQDHAGQKDVITLVRDFMIWSAFQGMNETDISQTDNETITIQIRDIRISGILETFGKSRESFQYLDKNNIIRVIDGIIEDKNNMWLDLLMQ